MESLSVAYKKKIIHLPFDKLINESESKVFKHDVYVVCHMISD